MADSNLQETPNQYSNGGTYEDPYYNTGNGGLLTFSGTFYATVNFEELIPYILIFMGYGFLATMGPWLFPPFIICLFATSGDLNECSLGSWGNAYKDPAYLCTNKSDWIYTELTDAQALCYYNNYSSTTLSNFSASNLCDVKIEWDTYGYYAGRNIACS